MREFKEFICDEVEQSCNSCVNQPMFEIADCCATCRVTLTGITNYKAMKKFPKPSNSENNGGKTGYYDLPLPDRNEILKIMLSPMASDLSEQEIAEAATDLILALCPHTLNDPIEHKQMKP